MSALVVGNLRLIVTVSDEDGHAPLLMVQRNTFNPGVKPVTVLAGLAGVVIAPAPLTRVQSPVPTVGVLPASVAVVPLTV